LPELCYLVFACAESDFTDSMTGSPFRRFIACFSWKSSAEPKSSRGGSVSTFAPGFVAA
jgi:hypothetical protein